MSTYSTLKFELIGTGQQAGAWGATTNANLGTAIEQAIAGTATCVTGDFTSNVATYTLADTTASQTARAYILNVTATLTDAGTINLPAISKPYIVINNSVGGFAVTVKVAGQTGVSIPNGKRTMVYNNATDVGIALDYLPALALGTDLAVADGGTGASTAATARANLSAAQSGANTDITSLAGLTTPISVAQGGTGATTAATARTGLGATTLGGNLFTITNPSAVTFPRFNADNTVSALNAADFRTAIGAGAAAGSNTQVQFNSSGSFGASSAFTFNTSGNKLTVNSLDFWRGNGADQNSVGAGYATLGAVTSGTYNTAVGSSVLTNLTQGASNVGVGATALTSATTGAENTAIGRGALYTTNTGSQNTAVGAYALYNQSNASAGTAVGYQAGYTLNGHSSDLFGYQAGKNLNQSANIAIGLQALYSASVSQATTAIGYQSAYYTLSSYNTFVGYQSGYGNGVASSFGQYNVGLGYQSLHNISTGAANNTAVGPSAGYAITTGGKNTLLGGFNGNQNSLDIRTSSNNIVLSDGDGQQRLVINSSGAWSASAAAPSYGTSGQVLKSNGSAAVPTWSDAAAGASGGIQYNNGSGGLASSVTLTFDGTYLNAGAIKVADLTSGRVPYATTSGQLVDSANLLYSGTDLTVSGVTVGRGGGANAGNTAVGADALASNTNGTANAAMGMSALTRAGTGVLDVTITNAGSGYTNGTYTGVSLTYVSGPAVVDLPVCEVYVSGGVVVLVVVTGGTKGRGFTTTGTVMSVSAASVGGTGSGFTCVPATLVSADGNTAIGYDSQVWNNVADGNTSVGAYSMLFNQAGNYGTAIGYNSLYNLINGDANTGVGAYTLDSCTYGQYNTGIGYNAATAVTTGTGNTALGASALAGNTTGNNNTVVGYNAYDSASTASNTAAFGTYALTNATSGPNAAFGYNAGGSVTTGTNNILLGNGAGTDAVRTITTGSNEIVVGNNSNTAAYIKVSWTVTSDARDKTAFAPVPHGLSFIKSLTPTAYRFKTSREDATPTGPTRYGFKAQDILAAEGETPVIIDASDAENLKYNQDSMIAILTNAIKELAAEFDAYKASHP